MEDISHLPIRRNSEGFRTPQIVRNDNLKPNMESVDDKRLN